ncbi:MAG: hypothetical protein WCX85_02100 [Bacilli bacterium]|jgi:hypothetical protein|nr:hypothetical protein [Bacilli bacterium]
MLNLDKNNKMTPRPDNEPKFDPKSKLDRKIISLALIGLLVVAILIAALVIVIELDLWAY